MHEQSIVEALLGLVLDNAEKAKAKKILKIYLVVGELSGVVEEAIEFYFSFLSRNTIAEQASLSFTHVQAQLHCRRCNTIFPFERDNYQCPGCRGQQVEIISGRELYVDSIEVE